MKITFNKKWDKVAVIAPSSGMEDALDNLKEGISLLTNNGFNCLYHKEIFSGTKVNFFAAEKKIRYSSLKNAIEDPEVKIIWVFRGGYGATEIVFDAMDLKPLNPKILIGYSDITALHALFNQSFNMVSMHTSGISSLMTNQTGMLGDILYMLEGNTANYELEPLNNVAMSEDKAIDAEITGGNLAVYCNLLATKLHPITKDKILIFEDTNEKGYQVHRYLVHLYNAGIFKEVKAVIFGDFVNGDDQIDLALEDFRTKYLAKIPVYKMEGFGHGKVNKPVLFNCPTRIYKNQLIIKSPIHCVS